MKNTISTYKYILNVCVYDKINDKISKSVRLLDINIERLNFDLLHKDKGTMLKWLIKSLNDVNKDNINEMGEVIDIFGIINYVDFVDKIKDINGYELGDYLDDTNKLRQLMSDCIEFDMGDINEIGGGANEYIRE